MALTRHKNLRANYNCHDSYVFNCSQLNYEPFKFAWRIESIDYLRKESQVTAL